MTELLTISIIDNDKGGHKDLVFSIPELIGKIKFDTYYISLAIEPKNGIEEIKKATAELLVFWREKSSKIGIGETIYLPIDFSDEYTGCLKVKRIENKLNLTYGFSRRAGYTVDPINPVDYYQSITDFQAENDNELNIEQQKWIDLLNKQILKLENK